MTEVETIDCSAAVETVETAWIPMSDGRRLAARLFLPADPAARPVPCILEYIPYRRRDGTRPRDDANHPWFAANGYAAARVDIAGSGDSDGLIQDEYHKREQDDALEIIAWLAAQPWCSGAVGMIGISWGGFNGLQVAARRPPALKAVISLCSTVDRYADDVHFMGGCILNDTLDWGCYFFNCGAAPPDPEVVGADRWREMWRHRIDNLDCYPMEWMAHQRRDAFWKHGSVCEDYGQIDIPVLNVSGWVDGYTAAVFRCVENLPGAQGIAGPWGHKYPNAGVPGPAIGFLQTCKRWWDRWLKGTANEADADPVLRVFLQDSAPPQPHFDERSGRWLGFPAWPAPQVAVQTLRLGERVLGSDVGPCGPLSVRSNLTTGIASGEWCAYGLGKVAPELATDQREDDAQSLCFDGPVLEAPLDIVGAPVVHLRLASDRPKAMVAVRLNCIHPTGEVERITYGLLNLTHRNSHEFPEPLEPGRSFDVAVPLNEIAQRVPAGCRLRLAVSTNYWPIAWPSPASATLTLDPPASRLDLPVLTTQEGLVPVAFEPALSAKASGIAVSDPGAETRELVFDIETQRMTFRIRRDDGAFTFNAIGTEVALTKLKEYSVSRDGSAQPVSRVLTTRHYRRGDWDARVETDVTMTSDEEHFHMTAEVRSWDAGAPFVMRSYARSFPREGV